jgi:hypothetical protein
MHARLSILCQQPAPLHPARTMRQSVMCREKRLTLAGGSATGWAIDANSGVSPLLCGFSSVMAAAGSMPLEHAASFRSAHARSSCTHSAS